ncbi:MAG: hypothetical protein DMG16_11475, partial [Acidobacteria bacterium]
KAMRRCLLEAFEETQGDREKMGRIIGRHPHNIPRLLEKFGLGHLKNIGLPPSVFRPPRKVVLISTPAPAFRHPKVGKAQS